MTRLVDCKDYKEKITESECVRRRETAEKMLKFLEKGHTIKTSTYAACLNCNRNFLDPDDKFGLEGTGFNAEGILKVLNQEGSAEPVTEEKNPTGEVKTCVDCGKPSTESRFNFKYDRCQYHATRYLRSLPDYRPRKYKRGEGKPEPPEQIVQDSTLDINFCSFCGANLTEEGSITISSTNMAHKSRETSKLVYDGTSNRIVTCVGCGKKLK